MENQELVDTKPKLSEPSNGEHQEIKCEEVESNKTVDIKIEQEPITSALPTTVITQRQRMITSGGLIR